MNAGIVEKEFARILTAEQEDREIGDYDIDIGLDEERVRKRVAEAESFVSRMEELVG